MKVNTTLRINMSGRAISPDSDGERFRAAVDMAAFADHNGFSIVNLEEHHCADIGWLSSPLIMAGVIAGRTQHVRIRVCALLITLYDPIRLAEDIAILDLTSNGRVSIVAGQGYRPIEFHALDRDWAERGNTTDFILQTLLTAWQGKPFEYRGKTVTVSPLPQSRPTPVFFYGGMSPAAARRAARFGLPFYPPAHLPELVAIYEQELQRHGNTGLADWPREGTSLIFIDEDPDAAWQEIGPHLLSESAEYGSWSREGVERPFASADLTLDQLRKQKLYEIITPVECLQRIREADGDYTVILHPLAGGIPVAKAWSCLNLYAEKVLKPLADAGRDG